MPGVRALALLSPAVAVAVVAGTAIAASPPSLDEAPAVRWRHARAWTVSSDDLLFGLVTDVIRLAGGTLAVADAQLGQVLLLGGDGSTEAVLPVAGEGPGQVRRLTGLGETSAGDLLLVQAWPGRVEVIARDGTPRRGLNPPGVEGDGGVATLLRVVPAGDLWLGLRVDVRPEAPGRSRSLLALAWLQPRDLAPAGVILRREALGELRQGFVDETAAHAPRRAWDVLPDGRAVVAPLRDAYCLEIHSRFDAEVIRLTRSHDPLPRPEAEKDLIRGGFRLTVDGRPQPIEFRLFETAAAIQTVVALDDGRVLLGSARRFHELPAGVTAILDLVDLDAATVGEVHLRVPCRPWIDAIVVLPDRDIVVVRNGFGGLAATGPGFAFATTAEGVPAIEYWNYQGEAP